MPYIKKERRKSIEKYGKLQKLIDTLISNTSHGIENNGDVTYVIYIILKAVYGEGCYETRSNALKVLSSTELEFYRKIIAPYEDEKIQENGDV